MAPPPCNPLETASEFRIQRTTLQDRAERPLIKIFANSFSISSSLFFYEGRENGERIAKVVVKGHAFLLDHFAITPVSHYFLTLSETRVYNYYLSLVSN